MQPFLTAFYKFVVPTAISLPKILVFRKFRPLDHRSVHRAIIQQFRWWSKLFLSTTHRPPPKFVEFYISDQYTYCQTFPNLWQRYCPTFGKGIAQRLVRVFSNVWQKCFPTFGKSVFQRFKNIFSTFDKGVIQRLIKVLSNGG